MKISFSQWSDFTQMAMAHLSMLGKKETELSGCINDMLAEQQRMNREHSRNMGSINRKHAAKDTEGFLVKDATGGYKYKPEDEDNRLEAIRILEDDKTKYEITPCIAAGIPELSAMEIKAFRGIVIPQDYQAEKAQSNGGAAKSSKE